MRYDESEASALELLPLFKNGSAAASTNVEFGNAVAGAQTLGRLCYAGTQLLDFGGRDTQLLCGLPVLARDYSSGDCPQKTLQKFSSVHARAHSHFNQERHLVTRQVFKQRHLAALIEWRALPV
jgi:hypothetical protein